MAGTHGHRPSADSLAAHLALLLVGSYADERSVPQPALRGPRQEPDLHHDLGRHPLLQLELLPRAAPLGEDAINRTTRDCAAGSRESVTQPARVARWPIGRISGLLPAIRRLPSASDHEGHRGSPPQKGGARGYELGDSHMLVATSTGARKRRERSAISARSAWSGETRPHRCSENLWRPSRGESAKRRPP
jgi:hypothetical protein